MRSTRWLWSWFVVGACGMSQPAAVTSQAAELDAAAAAAGVPVELVTAIAIEEGGLALPAHRTFDPHDAIPVAGRLELRRGKLDTLALGARLAGVTEQAIVEDTALGTRAGALVVAALGATDDPATWPAALAQLSGLDDASARAYATRVIATASGATPEARSPKPEALPSIIQVATDCTGKCDTDRPLGNAAVDKLVIHDTEGDWDASLATLQSQSGISVHYLVDADGSRVAQFIPETYTGWHAGNYFYNETSIGIEHVGHAADPAGYAAALYATSEALVRGIATRWPTIHLDRDHVVGHYQVPNGNAMPEDSAPCASPLASCETDDSYGGADNHRDPGLHWDWTGYLVALAPTTPVLVPVTQVDPASAADGGCGVGGTTPWSLALGLALGLWLRRRWRRDDVRPVS